MELTPQRTILACFAAVVLSFVSASAYEQWKTSSVERDALAIQGNAAPSILRLSAARAELRRLQYLTDDLVDSPRAERSFRFRAVAESLRAVGENIAVYSQLPFFPGEHELLAPVRSALRAVERDVDDIETALVQGDDGRLLLQRLHGDSETLSMALVRSTDYNGQIAAALADDIRHGRRRSMWLSFGLDLIGVALAMMAARLALRAVRARTELLSQLNRDTEQRATELERFAGRVSHDILSPLATVSLTVDHLARHDDGGDDARTRQLRRARTALDNVRHIVDGLLGFARAGARPDLRARAPLRDVVEECVLALSHAADAARVTVAARELPDVEVACSPGALGSVVSNLVANAIKYMGDAPVRLVEVSAATVQQSGRAFVRVEVADTGPGLPAGIDPARLFELYARGPAPRASGLGLGLATVRRVVEAYGGSVGVRPGAPSGSVFWFALPVSPKQRADQPMLPPPLAGAPEAAAIIS
jgi:signal transduction histidine kinase